MADAVSTTRKRVSKLACKAEELIHQLWNLEAKLTAVAAAGDLPEAEDLASRIACICVDHLHPAVDSLREAGKPRRRAETG
jgi:hypothetical protein